MVQYRIPTSSLDLPSFVDIKKHELSIELKASKLGTIESYDTLTGTATVKIQTLFNEKTANVYEYPLLKNVPVLKSKYFSFPINQGDGCLIIFLDTDFTRWLRDGAREVPLTPRLHDLNDAIAIVGIDKLSSRASFSNSNVVLDSKSGKIDIKNSTSSVTDVLQKILNCLTNLNTSLSAVLYQSGTTPLVTTLSTDIQAIKTEAQKILEGTIT